jgi:alkylated DNA repair protein alkB family protein 7
MKFHQDFSILPDVFTLSEQRTLLAAALETLDAVESRPLRRRRNAFRNETDMKTPGQSSTFQGLFLPDEYYQMEEARFFISLGNSVLNNIQGHYDGVIHHFREMHVTSWPDVPELSSIVDRLRSLCPTPETQTHILHLASNGEILPHVDNVEASGSWILGVSLGAQRIMHMVDLEDSDVSFDVLLPSGSVYLQK